MLKNVTATALRYLNDVLHTIVAPFAERIGPMFLLVVDNPRPHRARGINNFLAEADLQRMNWSALSPDLNPFEHIWDLLRRRLDNRSFEPQSINDLSEILLQEWDAIPQVAISNVISSMRRRCNAVIRGRGVGQSTKMSKFLEISYEIKEINWAADVP